MNHLALMLNPNLSAANLSQILEEDVRREARLVEDLGVEARRLKKEYGPGPAAEMLRSMADVHFAFGYPTAGAFAAIAAGLFELRAQTKAPR